MRLIRRIWAALMSSWIVERTFFSRKYTFRICDARVGGTRRAVSQVRVASYCSMKRTGYAASMLAIRGKAREAVVEGLKSGEIDMAATLDLVICWNGETFFYDGLPGELLSRL